MNSLTISKSDQGVRMQLEVKSRQKQWVNNKIEGRVQALSVLIMLLEALVELSIRIPLRTNNKYLLVGKMEVTIEMKIFSVQFWLC